MRKRAPVWVSQAGARCVSGTGGWGAGCACRARCVRVPTCRTHRSAACAVPAVPAFRATLPRAPRAALTLCAARLDRPRAASPHVSIASGVPRHCVRRACCERQLYPPLRRLSRVSHIASDAPAVPPALAAYTVPSCLVNPAPLHLDRPCTAALLFPPKNAVLGLPPCLPRGLENGEAGEFTSCRDPNLWNRRSDMVSMRGGFQSTALFDHALLSKPQ